MTTKQLALAVLAAFAFAANARAQNCVIDNKDPGDRVYSCGGPVTFLTRITPECAKGGCGLIVDVHGGTMNAVQMRNNTFLHELAPPLGYITVQPDAGDGFYDETDYPFVRAFMEAAFDAFSIDRKRVHFTGFSQGGRMTFFFICNNRDLLVSAAPFSSSGNQICGDQIDPTLPVLYMNGTRDRISVFNTEVLPSINGILARGEFDKGVQTAGDDTFTRTRFKNALGTPFDFIVHKYGGQDVLDGHCIPGGNDFTPIVGVSCDKPVSFAWGQIALDFFREQEAALKARESASGGGDVREVETVLRTRNGGQ